MSFLGHIVSQRVRLAIAQCSIALLILEIIAVAGGRLHINLATMSLLYMVVVVIIARVGDYVPSVFVSILASVLLAYVAPPAYSIRIDDPFDIVAVVAFTITSLIIARLVSTLRTMSKEALSSVDRKLVDAEEQVRARIGTELHDDIEQRLALLTNEIARVARRDTSLGGVEALKCMYAVEKTASRIAADVQALAYELRPYELEYLGVARVLEGYCKRFEEQHDMEVDFKSYALPKAVPRDASLSLSRILHEALHNSAKYSGTRHVEVELFAAREELHLVIRDTGVGFDPEAGMSGPGLGLVSMRERMKLVNGDLLVDSQPEAGCTIHARVPLSKHSTENSKLIFETS